MFLYHKQKYLFFISVDFLNIYIIEKIGGQFMKKIECGILVILIIAIFSLSIISMNTEEGVIETNANINKQQKIEWGIKRNDNHEQPDVGKDNRKVLEENEGICLGNKENKSIYLTFDEGYEAGYTEQILNTLKENEVKAAFFLTAHYINTQPDLVKQMIDEGHTIGNHIPLTLMTLF